MSKLRLKAVAVVYSRLINSRSPERASLVTFSLAQANQGTLMGGRAVGTIEEMQKIAIKRGGNCLSKNYKNAHSGLHWECSQGHQWEAKPMHIKRGHWCHICGARQSHENQRSTIEEMHQLAENRGGKCLSKEYLSDRGKLLWQCIDGHTWQTSPGNIKSGTWCPHCHIYFGEEIVRLFFEKTFGKKFPKSRPSFLKEQGSSIVELDGYNEELGIAFEHHGRQHYKSSKHFHRDKNSYRTIQERDRARAELCRKSRVKLIVVPSVPDLLPINELPKFLQSEFKRRKINIQAVPKRLNINVVYKKSAVKELQKIAESQKGRLISSHYLGTAIKLTWECKEGHQWDAIPSTIKKGIWCPTCAGRKRGTIEQMQKLAEDKGGKCLSEQYMGANSPLIWECKKGHQWKASPNSIKHQKSWCIICAGRQKSSIDEMHKLAIKMQGKCLSKEYINTGSKIRWQCKFGHQWEAVPNSVKQGYWCPACAGMQKGTIEAMRAIAKEYGGKCLSDKYINTHTKLTWQCKNGHEWKNTPAVIKYRKSWCPDCK